MSNAIVIVVVEDEILVRCSIVDAFEEHGYTVLEARDAPTCLELIRLAAEHVGVLLIDIGLPGPMNGLALAHKAQTQWPWIGIIIASATSIRAAELPPGARYIQKPYDPFSLVYAVQGLHGMNDQDCLVAQYASPASLIYDANI
jgi:DNA-binding response OmpR family regulator